MKWTLKEQKVWIDCCARVDHFLCCGECSGCGGQGSHTGNMQRREGRSDGRTMAHFLTILKENLAAMSRMKCILGCSRYHQGSS